MTRRNGLGLSTASSVLKSWAIDTDIPSLTSAAACLRFAAVIKLAVPSRSSFPQRPQLLFAWNSASNSAAVMVGVRGTILLGVCAAIGSRNAPTERAAAATPAARNPRRLVIIVSSRALTLAPDSRQLSYSSRSCVMTRVLLSARDGMAATFSHLIRDGVRVASREFGESDRTGRSYGLA